MNVHTVALAIGAPHSIAVIIVSDACASCLFRVDRQLAANDSSRHGRITILSRISTNTTYEGYRIAIKLQAASDFAAIS